MRNRAVSFGELISFLSIRKEYFAKRFLRNHFANRAFREVEEPAVLRASTNGKDTAFSPAENTTKLRSATEGAAMDLSG
jgi:hypothetical protein